MPGPQGGVVSRPVHSPAGPSPAPRLGVGPQNVPVLIDGCVWCAGHDGSGETGGWPDRNPAIRDDGTVDVEPDDAALPPLVSGVPQAPTRTAAIGIMNPSAPMRLRDFIPLRR
jgi:hypothetical protein